MKVSRHLNQSNSKILLEDTNAKQLIYLFVKNVGGAVASPDRAFRVQALAWDIVLCSWARHFTLTVPLSTQVCKWVLMSLMLGGNPAMD